MYTGWREPTSRSNAPTLERRSSVASVKTRDNNAPQLSQPINGCCFYLVHLRLATETTPNPRQIPAKSMTNKPRKTIRPVPARNLSSFSQQVFPLPLWQKENRAFVARLFHYNSIFGQRFVSFRTAFCSCAADVVYTDEYVLLYRRDKISFGSVCYLSC